MRRALFRCLAVLAATLGVLVGVIATPAAWAAQSPTPAECAAPPAGQPCVVVTGSSDKGGTIASADDVVHFTFALVNHGDTATVTTQFTLRSDLDIDYPSLRLDGQEVSGQGKSFQAAAPLAANGGQATLTFAASLGLDTPPTGSTTTLTVDGSTSNDVITLAPPVDLKIATDSTGVNEGNPLTGIELNIDLINRGVRDVRPRLTFPLPSGWTAKAAPDYTDHVSCSQSAGVVSCTDDQVLSDDGNQRFVAISVFPPRGKPAGTAITVVVHADPIGQTDDVPANNDATFHLRDAGTADLHVAVTSAATEVVKGHKVGFVVTVTNDGPDATDDLSVFLRVDTKTRNAVTQVDVRGPGKIGIGSADPVLAGPPYVWEPGPVRPGHTVRLTLAWRGEVLGATGRLEVSFSETAADPGAPVTQGLYQFGRIESRPITVVRTLSATPTPGEPIANTGLPSADRQLGLALLLLIGGVGLTVAGRRRPPLSRSGGR